MTGYKSKRAAAQDKLVVTDIDGHVVRDARKPKKAQPAQEPVAWLEPEWGEKICPEVGYEVTMTDDHPRDLCWIPLYPHPPQEPWPEEPFGHMAGGVQPPQREWVDLTEDQIKVIEEMALTKQWAIRMTIAQLKECNA